MARAATPKDERDDEPEGDAGSPREIGDDNPKDHPTSNAEKDPSDWVTGDEPMTGAQASYLKTLCEETGEDFDAGLSKAAASEMIDRLKGQSPRLKDA